MSPSQALIITGMHRSGTSLLTSLVGKAGVKIGEHLLEPNFGNPRGYFEDVEFYFLHERILRRLGEDVMAQDTAKLREPDAEETSRARELIAARIGQPLWGWKDPRTALFLDFWHGLLDDARYLFIFRHPIDVLLSLRRRGSDFDVVADATVGLRAWKTYNLRQLEFYQRHSDRCLLVDLYAALEDIPGFLGLLTEKLGLSLATTGLEEQLFVGSELRRSDATPAVERVLRFVDPEAWSLYHQLNRAADLVGSAQSIPRGDEELRPEPISDLVSEWVAEAPRQQVLARPVLDMLLAQLDPELAKPHRLSDPLVQHIRGQKLRLAELQEELGDDRSGSAPDLEQRLSALEEELQGELDEQTGKVLDLEQRLRTLRREFKGELDERADRILDLEQRLMQQHERVKEQSIRALRLRNQVDEGKADTFELQAKLAERDLRIQQLEAVIAEKDEHLFGLDFALRTESRNLSKAKH